MEKQMEDLKINDNKDIRHCSFCLTSVASQDIKLCGSCRKRAYCSKECQVADWSLKKDAGQGHKNWCKLGCGEEDIDWEVCPVPGKGLGLIAKRLIPAKFRIIVDAVRPRHHPAAKYLMPLDGTMEEKFKLNALDCGSNNEDALCLRISRANHSCEANAGHYYDDTFKVIIMFSEREIQKDEEICINYQPFNDISKYRSADQTRYVLRAHWGIECPSDCICRDQDIANLVKESSQLDSDIFRMGRKGNIHDALIMVNQLMKDHDVMKTSLINRSRTLYDGFQIAIMKRSTCKNGEKFMREAYFILASILSPESEMCLQYAQYTKKPALHPCYFVFE